MSARRLKRRQCVSCFAPLSAGIRQCPTCELSVVTIMVADLSGSTPLGERLDPEELREILAGFFRELSRQITRAGGTVDKYVGDAIRARFSGAPGESSAIRAVRAGLAMQAALAGQNTDLERRYGVRLSLRVGVNTGAVVRGAAGDPRAAALMLGATVTLAEQLEKRAAPNTVLVGERTRVLAQDTFVFAARAIDAGSTPAITAYVARRPRKHAGAGQDTDGTLAGGGSASLQVGTQQAHVLEEQRKIVTILFVDISSSEPLGSRLDEAQQGEVLAGYFAAVADPIQRFGGTIDKYIGDAVMAVFGAPVSHEDDGARAIAAGLDIKQAIARGNVELEWRHGLRLAVRIGINTGEVVAGLLPGEVDAYTVTGDAVNTAQRIESVAPANEVLVSETTRSLAADRFVYEPVAPLRLKGKSQPVPAFRVLGPERRASARGGPTLVGRARELGLLYEALRAANEGNGRLLHVRGEAGVGKTRLVAELLGGMPREARRLRSRASSYEVATPYAVIADLLRRLLLLQPGDSEAIAAHALAGLVDFVAPVARESAIAIFIEVLGYEQRSPLEPEQKRGILLSLLRQLITHLSATTTLVVIVEDLHWSDATSAGLLTDLVGDVVGLRCLFLTTSRGEWTPPWPHELLELGALDPAAALELVDRASIAPLDEATRQLVLDRTEGNPFFIQEIVRALSEGRTVTVPATVQDFLEASIDALEADPRHLAERGSVIGRSFWTRVLERVAPMADLEAGLATLVTERFIEPREAVVERTYAFHHALVQEVTYKTQLLSQRRSAHALVGTAFEELFADRLDEFTDTLAFHYDHSDADAKALHWLMRAGDRARSLFANTEALRSYEAALRRAQDGEGASGAGTILERIGDVQSLTGRFADAIATFRTARERVPNPAPATLARLHRKDGMAHRARGEFAEAAAAFANATAALHGVADVEAAHVAVQTGQLLMRQADNVAAREALSRAIELGTQLGADDVVAEGLKYLGNVANTLGDLPGAITNYERSREVYTRLEHPTGMADVRNNLGSVYRRMGRHEEALAEFGAAVLTMERTGYLYGLAAAQNNIGAVHVTRGVPADGIVAYERAAEIWRSIGSRAEAALALMNLGEALLEAGDVARARVVLASARDELEHLERSFYLPSLYRFIARADLAAGELDDAETSAQRSLELARAAGRRHVEALAQRVLAEIATQRTDIPAARSLLEASRDLLRELGETAELARTEALLETLPRP